MVDGEEPDEILDRIDSAADKASIIRQLSARQVHACLALACENAAQEKQSAVSDLEKDLAVSTSFSDIHDGALTSRGCRPRSLLVMLGDSGCSGSETRGRMRGRQSRPGLLS